MPKYLGMTDLPREQEERLLRAPPAELLRVINEAASSPRLLSAGDSYALVQRVAAAGLALLVREGVKPAGVSRGGVKPADVVQDGTLPAQKESLWGPFVDRGSYIHSPPTPRKVPRGHGEPRGHLPEADCIHALESAGVVVTEEWRSRISRFAATNPGLLAMQMGNAIAAAARRASPTRSKSKGQKPGAPSTHCKVGPPTHRKTPTE